MKFFQLLTFLFVFLLVKSDSIAQDLIERTQQQIPKSTLSATPNHLAKLVQRQHQSKARFSEFAPFEVDNAQSAIGDNFVTGAVNLTIKEEQLDIFIANQPTSTTLKIPVDQKSTFELELFQVSVFSEDFIFRTSEGQDLTELGNGVFYRGIVKGDPNSVAAASIFNDEIRIMIGDNDGNYVIGKRKDMEAHVLYNDKNLLLDEPVGCAAGATEDLTKDNITAQIESEARNSMNKCVPVYIECDYDMFKKQGDSEANVIAFVSALMNEVATIYANEQISISLSDVKVWTTPDPYAGMNSTSTILREFGRLTKNNYNGRLAHFISTRSLGGGIAWVNVLCAGYSSNQHSGPYAVSAGMGTSITTFPTYSWNVEVFTHEMGHNMGSPHTQNCSWNGNNTAIDACAPTEGGCSSLYGACPPNGGTIMSYCHITNCGTDFNNGFGQQPGDLIRSRYNNANCTLSCAAPTCDDGIQNGDEEGIDCGGSNCDPCPCYGSTIEFNLTLDRYADETSWALTNATGSTLYSGGNYRRSFQNITETFELPEASGYVFTIIDRYSDGICCQYGNGSFSLTDENGQVIASGGSFGASYIATFCTGGSGSGGGNSSNDICQTNVTVNPNLLNNNSVIAAENILTTSGTVAFTKNVIFKAGQSVTLQAGFHAQTGSSFTAMIEGCNPSNSPSDSLDARSVNRLTVPTSKNERMDLTVAPNPFQSYTSIRFNLPQKETIRLQVLDVNGRVAQTLVDKVETPAGYHAFDLERSQLPSGVYYVFLTTKSNMVSRKVVLID